MEISGNDTQNAEFEGNKNRSTGCLSGEAVDDPNEIRTRVSALKGPRPGPLDDGAKLPPVYQSTGTASSLVLEFRGEIPQIS